MPTDVTPWTALSGGLLIGAAVVLLMLVNGQIAGISGIAARVLPPYLAGAPWRELAFLAGLAAAPILFMALTGEAVAQTISADFATLAAGGLLVGLGAAYGNGCTSGHGVCGLSLLSPRSFVATAVFMATAIATVFVVRHLGGL